VTRKNNRLLLALLAFLLSAAALFFGTGLHPLWWLTWLAAIPVLVMAPRLSGIWAFLVAFFAWAVGATNQWHFFLRALKIPIGTVLLFTLLPALLFGVAVLLYRTFVLRSAVWRAALIVPSIWVVAEFLTSRISIHGTAGNLAYTQMNFLPILQMASLTGIWGISFCILLFATTVSILLGGYGSLRGRRRRLGISVGCVLVAALGFGIWRLMSTPSSPTVKVALLSSDLKQNLQTQQHADTIRLLEDYVVQAQKVAQEGAKVIVIPEKIAVLTPADIEDVDQLLQSAAKQTGAQIIVGVVHITPDAQLNEARIYSPGAEILTYEKHHLLPPFESKMRPGTRMTEWQGPSGLWGVEICKDTDFPKLSLDYGNDGVGLVLVPAWDFVADGWLHGRMAILRGVESGFSIARSPKDGILTVSDDRGRVVAQEVSSEEPFVSVVAAAAVRNDHTFYDRHGDWFAWLNLGLFIVLVISRWFIPGRPVVRDSA
jgi:apolipoprotein N-acyltransferase